MTVYIDIVIIENLIINYFLILTTTQIIGIKTKEINMFLASLLGSVYTLFIFLPKSGSYFKSIYYIFYDFIYVCWNMFFLFINPK